MPKGGASALPSRSESLLVQDEVHRPTASNMWSQSSAVGENIGIVTAGIFQGIGQDWQLLESSVLINGLSNPHNSGIVPGEPGGIKDHLSERIAEDIADQCGLTGIFGVLPAPSVLSGVVHGIGVGTVLVPGCVGNGMRGVARTCQLGPAGIASCHTTHQFAPCQTDRMGTLIGLNQFILANLTVCEGFGNLNCVTQLLVG